MTATGGQLNMRAYQRLVEAQAMQRHLGCHSLSQAADVVRQVLITQVGLRRFLGTFLNSHGKEPSAGWVVEFGHGWHQVNLKDAGVTLLDAVVEVVEEYQQRSEWPTGVRKNNLYVEL